MAEDNALDQNQSPDKSPRSSPAPLVRQPHGGALLRGGNWGNRGGGRPPSAIKAAMRASFEEMLPRLRKLTRTRKKTNADGTVTIEKPDVATLLRIAELFAKYGMDEAVSVADVRAALKKTRAEIDELLGADQGKVLWERISEHWLSL